MNIPIKRYWTLLVQYLRPQSLRVAILGILLFAILATQLINPQIVRYFLDTAQSGSSLRALIWVGILFFVVALLEQALVILSRYLGEVVAWKATNQLREDLAVHCLQLDMSFHKTHTPGEMIERIDGDIQDLADFFSQFTLVLLGNLLLLVGVLTLLWWEDWRIGLIVTIIAVFALIIVNQIRMAAVPYWHRVRQASAALFGFLEERLKSTEEIRANGARPYVMHRLYESMGLLFRQEYSATKFQLLSTGTAYFLFGLAQAIAFILTFNAFRSGQMSIGTVYVIFYYMALLYSIVFTVINQLDNLQKAGASIARIEELYQMQSRIQSGPQDFRLIGPPQVDFDNVVFHYDLDEMAVLDHITFRLEAGRVLGLLGRTGSGKTTITRMLFRLYDPTSGTIRLSNGNGQVATLQDIHLKNIRGQIGLVTQEVQLFHATIRDNLTLFDDSIPDSKIIKVIRELGQEDWFSSLPDGLDTVLQGTDSGLSAGEAQLLAFMRVFLEDPFLVILDEASSRLDLATERAIAHSTAKLLKNRTGIIIAHRLETIQRVDDIIILENGRIREHGPREQLANDKNSYFAHLLHTNLQDFIQDIEPQAHKQVSR